MSSIFASRTQQAIALPFDEGQSVTIQKLSGQQLGKCREARQVAFSEEMARMGALLKAQKEFRDIAPAADTPAVAVEAAPMVDVLAAYDRAAVLQRGVKAWTYAEPVTPDALADLTEEAADFLARAILTLTLPEPGDAGTKNG